MLNELFEIAEYVVTGIIPAVLVLYILYVVFNIHKRISHVKYLIGIVFVGALTFSIMICMVFQIYQVSMMFETIDTKMTIEPWFRTFSFLMVETFYTVVFVIGMFVIVYFETHQIIPGKGSVKNRLKYHYKNLKEELNESRRKRTTKRDKRKV